MRARLRRCSSNRDLRRARRGRAERLGRDGRCSDRSEPGAGSVAPRAPAPVGRRARGDRRRGHRDGAACAGRVCACATGRANDAHLHIAAASERLLSSTTAPLRAGLAGSAAPRRASGARRRLQRAGARSGSASASTSTRAVHVAALGARARHAAIRHGRPALVSAPLRPDTSRSMRPPGAVGRWLPAVAVLGVLVVTSLGGFVTSAALSEPAGPLVSIPGEVSVQPLSGWEPIDAGSISGRPVVWLTRGSGTLAVVAWGPVAGDAASLSAEVVDVLLRDQLDRLSVSQALTPVAAGEVDGGTVHVRRHRPRNGRRRRRGDHRRGHARRAAAWSSSASPPKGRWRSSTTTCIR